MLAFLMVEQREEELDAQQEVSSTRCARVENQIADHQAKIAEADEHFTKAQDTVSEQIRDLEERLLEAQQKNLGHQEATEKQLTGGLKTAKEHVESLLSTIRSNAQDLQMYRDRAEAQRQHAGPSPSSGYHPIHHHSPTPIQFPPPSPPQQRGMHQIPAQRQSPFANHPA
ncbi:hypothetical protein MMC22_002932 [Lobaria immixta]|nr:hypothetical protein [Lobaria immixta]